MANLYNMVWVTTATVGTGTIALGAAVTGYRTFAEANVANGAMVSYRIKDGVAWEVGRGVYTSSGALLSRSVLASSNGGAAISLSGSAEVFITALAEDIGLDSASIASSATPTPNADRQDQYNVTALAANATFGAPTGTPADGQKLIIRVKDDGTARTLAWNAIYRAIVALPTTTTISKTLYLGFIYNAADAKWDLVAKSQEA